MAAFLALSVLPSPAMAQTVFQLPAPGTMVPLSQAFVPATIKGIKLHPENPLRFDFIIDIGDSGLAAEALQDEADRLIKYFLASLTVPEEDLWVNLSPFEKDRIIPDEFGVTEMGRDLLAQDYLLKQITSSLIYPESELGQKFWDRIYAKASEKYGTIDIPVNTFNKVWVVPEKAKIYKNGNAAFVVKAHLKVMLEEDYVALQQDRKSAASRGVSTAKVSSDILREIIIPELEKEVNEGKNFAQLRQVYNSLILATWFKRNLKENILAKVYIGKNKVEGVDIADKDTKQKIYEAYLEAYKKGVYNFIREEYDPATEEEIPRKYFSGGMKMTMLAAETGEVLDETGTAPEVQFKNRAMMATADLRPSDDTGEGYTMDRPSQSVYFPRDYYDTSSRNFRLWYGDAKAELSPRVNAYRGRGLMDYVRAEEQQNRASDIERVRTIMAKVEADPSTPLLVEVGGGDTRIATAFAERNPGLNVLTFDAYDVEDPEEFAGPARAFVAGELAAQQSDLTDRLAAVRGELEMLTLLPDASVDYLVLVLPTTGIYEDLTVLIREFGLMNKLKPKGSIVFRTSESVKDYVGLMQGRLAVAQREGYQFLGVDLLELSEWQQPQILQGNVYIASRIDLSRSGGDRAMRSDRVKPANLLYRVGTHMGQTREPASADLVDGVLTYVKEEARRTLRKINAGPDIETFDYDDSSVIDVRKFAPGVGIPTESRLDLIKLGELGLAPQIHNIARIPDRSVSYRHDFAQYQYIHREKILGSTVKELIDINGRLTDDQKQKILDLIDRLVLNKAWSSELFHTLYWSLEGNIKIGKGQASQEERAFLDIRENIPRNVFESRFAGDEDSAWAYYAGIYLDFIRELRGMATLTSNRGNLLYPAAPGALANWERHFKFIEDHLRDIHEGKVRLTDRAMLTVRPQGDLTPEEEKLQRGRKINRYIQELSGASVDDGSSAKTSRTLRLVAAAILNDGELLRPSRLFGEDDLSIAESRSEDFSIDTARQLIWETLSTLPEDRAIFESYERTLEEIGARLAEQDEGIVDVSPAAMRQEGKALKVGFNGNMYSFEVRQSMFVPGRFRVEHFSVGGYPIWMQLRNPDGSFSQAEERLTVNEGDVIEIFGDPEMRRFYRIGDRTFLIEEDEGRWNLIEKELNYDQVIMERRISFEPERISVETFQDALTKTVLEPVPLEVTMAYPMASYARMSVFYTEPFGVVIGEKEFTVQRQADGQEFFIVAEDGSEFPIPLAENVYIEVEAPNRIMTQEEFFANVVPAISLTGNEFRSARIDINITGEAPPDRVSIQLSDRRSAEVPDYNLEELLFNTGNFTPGEEVGISAMPVSGMITGIFTEIGLELRRNQYGVVVANVLEDYQLEVPEAARAAASPVLLSSIERYNERVRSRRRDRAMTTYNREALAADTRTPLEIFLAHSPRADEYSNLEQLRARLQLGPEANLNALIAKYMRDSHFNASRAQFIEEDLENVPPVFRALLLDIIEFTEAAYKNTENADDARAFSWKLGEMAFDGEYAEHPEYFSDTAFPLSELIMDGERLEALPILDLAAGPRASWYLPDVGSRKMVIADYSYFIEGFLNRAKVVLGVGDNVEIRRVDVRDAEALFRGEKFRHVRMGNVDTYVGDLPAEFYDQLTDSIVPGGTISVESKTVRLPIFPEEIPRSVEQLMDRVGRDVDWMMSEGTFQGLSYEPIKFIAFLYQPMATFSDAVARYAQDGPVQLRMAARADNDLYRIIIERSGTQPVRVELPIKYERLFQALTFGDRDRDEITFQFDQNVSERQILRTLNRIVAEIVIGRFAEDLLDMIPETDSELRIDWNDPKVLPGAAVLWKENGARKTLLLEPSAKRMLMDLIPEGRIVPGGMVTRVMIRKDNRQAGVFVNDLKQGLAKAATGIASDRAMTGTVWDRMNVTFKGSSAAAAFGFLALCTGACTVTPGKFGGARPEYRQAMNEPVNPDRLKIFLRAIETMAEFFSNPYDEKTNPYGIKPEEAFTAAQAFSPELSAEIKAITDLFTNEVIAARGRSRFSPALRRANQMLMEKTSALAEKYFPLTGRWKLSDDRYARDPISHKQLILSEYSPELIQIKIEAKQEIPEDSPLHQLITEDVSLTIPEFDGNVQDLALTMVRGEEKTVLKTRVISKGFHTPTVGYISLSVADDAGNEVEVDIQATHLSPGLGLLKYFGAAGKTFPVVNAVPPAKLQAMNQVHAEYQAEQDRTVQGLLRDRLKDINEYFAGINDTQKKREILQAGIAPILMQYYADIERLLVRRMFRELQGPVRFFGGDLRETPAAVINETYGKMLESLQETIRDLDSRDRAMTGGRSGEEEFFRRLLHDDYDKYIQVAQRVIEPLGDAEAAANDPDAISVSELLKHIFVFENAGAAYRMLVNAPRPLNDQEMNALKDHLLRILRDMNTAYKPVMNQPTHDGRMLKYIVMNTFFKGAVEFLNRVLAVPGGLYRDGNYTDENAARFQEIERLLPTVAPDIVQMRDRREQEIRDERGQGPAAEASLLQSIRQVAGQVTATVDAGQAKAEFDRFVQRLKTMPVAAQAGEDLLLFRDVLGNLRAKVRDGSVQVSDAEQMVLLAALLNGIDPAQGFSLRSGEAGERNGILFQETMHTAAVISRVGETKRQALERTKAFAANMLGSDLSAHIDYIENTVPSVQKIVYRMDQPKPASDGDRAMTTADPRSEAYAQDSARYVELSSVLNDRPAFLLSEPPRENAVYNFYGHGSNAFTLLNIFRTNLQLVPGAIRRDLEINSPLGEAGPEGVYYTDEFVPLVALIQESSRMSTVTRYARSATDRFRVTPENVNAMIRSEKKEHLQFLRKNFGLAWRLTSRYRNNPLHREHVQRIRQLESMKDWFGTLSAGELEEYLALTQIPAIFLGDAAGAAASRPESVRMVDNEVPRERLNTRIVAVPAEHITRVRELLARFGHADDVLVLELDRLPRYDGGRLGLLYRNLFDNGDYEDELKGTEITLQNALGRNVRTDDSLLNTWAYASPRDFRIVAQALQELAGQIDPRIVNITIWHTDEFDITSPTVDIREIWMYAGGVRTPTGEFAVYIDVDEFPNFSLEEAKEALTVGMNISDRAMQSEGPTEWLRDDVEDYVDAAYSGGFTASTIRNLGAQQLETILRRLDDEDTRLTGMIGSAMDDAENADITRAVAGMREAQRIVTARIRDLNDRAQEIQDAKNILQTAYLEHRVRARLAKYRTTDNDSLLATRMIKLIAVASGLRQENTLGDRVALTEKLEADALAKLGDFSLERAQELTNKRQHIRYTFTYRQLERMMQMSETLPTAIDDIVTVLDRAVENGEFLTVRASPGEHVGVLTVQHNPFDETVKRIKPENRSAENVSQYQIAVTADGKLQPAAWEHKVQPFVLEQAMRLYNASEAGRVATPNFGRAGGSRDRAMTGDGQQDLAPIISKIYNGRFQDSDLQGLSMQQLESLLREIDDQAERLSELSEIGDEDEYERGSFEVGLLKQAGETVAAKMGELREQGFSDEPDITGDRAMTTADPVGGIDLNPTNLNIEAEGEDIRIDLPNLDPAMFEGPGFKGLTPFIIQIVPVTNLPLLLGTNEPQGQEKLSMR